MIIINSIKSKFFFEATINILNTPYHQTRNISDTIIQIWVFIFWSNMYVLWNLPNLPFGGLFRYVWGYNKLQKSVVMTSSQWKPSIGAPMKASLWEGQAHQRLYFCHLNSIWSYFVRKQRSLTTDLAIILWCLEQHPWSNYYYVSVNGNFLCWRKEHLFFWRQL